MAKIFKRTILFILMAAMAAGISFVSANEAQASSKTVSGTYRYDYAYEVLDIVNKERRAAGLSSLAMDKTLLNAADIRAAETVVNVSHTRPNGENYTTVSSKISGENLACTTKAKTPKAVMELWMASSVHKANILNSSYTSIGISCFVSDDGTYYWIQEFGREQAEKISQPANKKAVVSVATSAGSTTKAKSSAATKTSLSNASITLSKTSHTYNGKRHKPSATVKLNGKTLAKNTDYTVAYKNCKKVGTATLTITGKGDYTGSKSVSYKIKKPKVGKTSLKSVSNVGAKTAKLTYSSVNKANGYEVEWSTSKKFKNSKTNRGTATKTKVRIENMKSGEKYYVRVRAFRNVGGKKFYGRWSEAKSVEIIE